ncbi:cobalamin biosynthesis protein CobQ [Amylibacter marinus]|nr:cobalamin biosynthesis protein CobQ [Amylibacter marinus]
MNTPAHIIIAAAAFAQPNKPKITWWAIFGGVLPDLSLYLMVLWARLIGGHSFGRIFDEFYFSNSWQAVFAIDNSIPLWGAILLWAIWRRIWAAIAFAGSGMLHLVSDFLLHNDDARRHFWPFSDWVFESPVSYWDPAHFGQIVGMLESLCVLILGGWLIWRFGRCKISLFFGALLAFQLLPSLLFYYLH